MVPVPQLRDRLHERRTVTDDEQTTRERIRADHAALERVYRALTEARTQTGEHHGRHERANTPDHPPER